MLFGFSYTYQDILQEIARLNRQDKKTIDPKTSAFKKYHKSLIQKPVLKHVKPMQATFVPVVSRTTSHSQQTWEFLVSLSDPAQMKVYNANTKKPARYAAFFLSKK